MCILIDACVRDRVFGEMPEPDAQPVLDWVQRAGGAIVVGGKLYDELKRSRRARAQIDEWKRTGKARVPAADRLARADAEVAKLSLRSNDAHIIALARASGARTLYTVDGTTSGLLMADFCDKALIDKPRGKVYQRAEHSKLLVHTRGCPMWKAK